MRISRRGLLIFVGLFSMVALGGNRLLAEPPKKLRVECVAAAKGASLISFPEFQNKMSRVFSGHALSFHPNSLHVRDLIASIQRADVFFFSGHSGIPTVTPDRHALMGWGQTKPGNEFPETALLSSVEIREALQGQTGPKLVIVNGCNTTDPNDGIVDEKRMSYAFNATPAGCAYLGWSTPVAGVLADRLIGRLLDIWTTPQADGTYVTIAKAQELAGIKKLVIVGNRELTYRQLVREESSTAPTPETSGKKAALASSVDDASLKKTYPTVSGVKVVRYEWDLLVWETQGVGVTLKGYKHLAKRAGRTHGYTRSKDVRIEPHGQHRFKGHFVYYVEDERGPASHTMTYSGVDDNGNRIEHTHTVLR